jgi:hypothetical protein
VSGIPVLGAHLQQAQEVSLLIRHKHRRCRCSFATSTGGVAAHLPQAQEVSPGNKRHRKEDNDPAVLGE